MTRRVPKLSAWIVLPLAGLLLLFGAISFALRVGASQPAPGVEWIQSSAGPVAVTVKPDGAAWAAGVREGDLLLRAAGRPISSAMEAGQLHWNATDRLSLTVRRGAADLSFEVVPVWGSRSEPYTYLAIVGLAFWVSGLFIALRWPSIRGGALYALLACCLFGQLVLSHTGKADAVDWSIYWADVLAAAFAPAVLLHFGIALSKRRSRALVWVLRSAYAVAGLLVSAALWLSPGGLGGAWRFADPVRALELRDRAETLFLGISLVLTFTLLVNSYVLSSAARRRGQLRWLLWGLAVGFGPFVLLYAIPWSMGAPGLPGWAQLVSVVPILFVPAAFTAALARYRLHDVDLILMRGFSEVSAVFCAFAVYATAVFLLREGLGDWVPLSRSGTRYFGLFGMALAYPQLRTWVRRGVERAFYRKRYSYRTTLLDWARDLSAETDLPSLLDNLRTRIRETLGVAEAGVLVWTGDHRFESIGAANESEPFDLDPGAFERLTREPYIEFVDAAPAAIGWARYLFALRVKGQLRAVLAISERPRPEEPLTSEDRALLTTLSAHAATAIEAARLVLEVRQRAEEIEDLHARQAKILESSAVGLMLVDDAGRVQAWNPALEAICGQPRDTAIGRPVEEVLPLQVVRRIEREGNVEPAEGERRFFRLSMVNGQGQRVIVNLSISPVDGDHGQGGAKVVTFDDVSERVKLEEQVLRQERLASLGLLAAGVAHEINTPLTGISSYAQMLLEECPQDDPRRKTLQKIEIQTQRAARITGSMLNMARPEGTFFEALDINETIREVLNLFEPQVRGCANVALRLDLAEELPTLRGNRGKLQQMLLNLLMNARDAVSEGGTISVASREQDGRIVVDVMDDGVGIAEEDLPSIFDPFFTTKGRRKGTGLGLSISYGIVQEHEGEIHVVSRPGELTRFRVELPTARTERALA